MANIKMLAKKAAIGLISKTLRSCQLDPIGSVRKTARA